MTIRQIAAAGLVFVRARRNLRRLRSREQVARHQQRQIARLLDHAARHFPYYRACAGLPLCEWPVIDKRELLANFAALNLPGLSVEQVRDALAEGRGHIGGHAIGRSTGTSGNRGYYVISDIERFTWLGTILAKALPDALWHRHRVALALPTEASLYHSAGAGSRIALRFFDLAQGPESWAQDLAAFDPDTIVAPPKVLRWLAERGGLTARNLFSGAEVLDPLDRAAIEAASGRPLREIYMATEGLFGVSCAHGTLHLAEDVVHFEYERPDPASPLVVPVVTDFTRRSQAMIRYRMNDLIELSDDPCPCGSALQPVRRIEGRSDDVFQLPAADGALRMVTPDVLRNTVVDSDPSIHDYRVIQTGANAVQLALPPGLPPGVPDKARAALITHFAARGLAPEVTLVPLEAVPFDRKLRRVRREWAG